ncbi:MAG: imelysin family protein, partial [Alphaproteobacteria bacterium]|nr:imelysin family protein [Alphaproteobacteria bacterium]
MFKQSLAAAGLLALSACATDSGSENSSYSEVTKDNVVTTYGNIALAVYEDSLMTAKGLKAAVDQLVSNPSQQNLDTAREAWVKARVPYQQSEVYRFGNAAVDDWEGKVNAWP